MTPIRLALPALGAALALTTFANVSAHPHVAEHSPHQQVLANGQNHPGFQPINGDGLRLSCEGALMPGDAGPAGYGLETAHHGPDAGNPGKSDGCYAVRGNPTDGNPGIN
jgi:hypothetical protein